MKEVAVHGKITLVITTEEMVGHQIIAMHKRNVQHISRRGESAALRARKVNGLAMTRRQTTRLIQVAVILAAFAGTLWDIPQQSQSTGDLLPMAPMTTRSKRKP